IARDPMRILRRNLDIARMGRQGHEAFLLITHDLGGGTDKHVHDLARQLQKSGITPIILYPENVRTGSVRLLRYDITALPNAVFNLRQEWPAFIEALKHLHIRHLHYHHLLHLPAAIRTLPKALGLSYDVTLHDYYSICPRTNFVNETKEYCGEPDATV